MNCGPSEFDAQCGTSFRTWCTALRFFGMTASGGWCRGSHPNPDLAGGVVLRDAKKDRTRERRPKA